MASSEPNRRTMGSANVTSDVRAHIDRKQNERCWTSVGERRGEVWLGEQGTNAKTTTTLRENVLQIDPFVYK